MKQTTTHSHDSHRTTGGDLSLRPQDLSHRHFSLASFLQSRPLLPGLLGITLLLPATYFMGTMLLRLCFGPTSLYYSIAPSFLQSPFGFFALHKAQVILYGPLLAILVNGLTILRIRLRRVERNWTFSVSYNRYWLNTAIALQSLLLFLVLVAYTLIQHIRY